MYDITIKIPIFHLPSFIFLGVFSLMWIVGGFAANEKELVCNNNYINVGTWLIVSGVIGVLRYLIIPINYRDTGLILCECNSGSIIDNIIRFVCPSILLLWTVFGIILLSNMHGCQKTSIHDLSLYLYTILAVVCNLLGLLLSFDISYNEYIEII